MGAFIRSNFGHVKFKMSASFYPLKNDKINIPNLNIIYNFLLFSKFENMNKVIEFLAKFNW